MSDDPFSHPEDQNPKQVRNRKSKIQDPARGPQEPTARPRQRVQFGPPSSKPVAGKIEPTEKVVKKREPKPKVKNDPRLVAAARELRDRYLEQLESGAYLPEPCGKYEVTKQIEDHGRDAHATVETIKTVPLLAA